MPALTINALTMTRERPGSTTSGFPMLVVLLLAAAIIIWGAVQLITNDFSILSIAVW